MSDESKQPDPNPLQREVDYYKRQLKSVAAQNMQYEFKLASVQYQLRQKRQGFALLSRLSNTLGAHGEIGTILDLAAEGVQSALAVDRTVVLVPAEGARFRVRRCFGYARDDAARLVDIELEVPPELLADDVALLANGSAEPTPFIEGVREALAISYFILAPVIVEDQHIAILLTGRLRELPPNNPALDDGDLDTFRSLASLVASTIRNTRLAVLEEMDRLKTDFFANISHEFRTPITLSLGPIEGVLAGRYGDFAAPVRSQLELVQSNQRRLLGLINQILDLAKLEAGQMELRVAPVRDFNELVRSRAELFEPALKQRGLSLELSLDPAVVGANIFLDYDKFDHVLMNLLSNAYKFTQRGHVGVETKLENGSVRVSVSDTGVGIREDQLPHVFDRFHQADGSSSTVQVGTGIGLSFVKEMVVRHGGEISVESHHGKGSAFHVRLPLGMVHLKDTLIVEEPAAQDAPRADTMLPTGSAPPPASGQDGADATPLDPAKELVLYVDDNAELRRYVRDLLSARYNVVVASNGREGLVRALERPPHLILSDFMMPEMDGLELCRAVRAEPALQGVPFVLLTAKEGVDSKIAGLEEGADDYMGKPFSEQELLARVRNLLEARRQQLALQSELRAAREIQRTLLPHMPRDLPGGARLDVLYRPTELLSGDFYDVLESGGWVYWYVADVTSHGTAAAQVTYLVKSAFGEALEGKALGLPELLDRVTARYASYGVEYDVGVQAGRFHPSDGVLEVVRGNAPPAFLIRDGAGSLLQPRPGPPLSRSLGDQPPRFEPSRAELRPGDAVYFVTDGCYEFEQRRGRQFGLKNLLGVLRSIDGPGWAEEAWERLVDQSASGTFDDDLTLLRLTVG